MDYTTKEGVVVTVTDECVIITPPEGRAIAGQEPGKIEMTVVLAAESPEPSPEAG